jgi:hypothetical protein
MSGYVENAGTACSLTQLARDDRAGVSVTAEQSCDIDHRNF